MLSPPPISRTRTRLVLTRIPDSWAWVRTDLLIRLLPFAARSEEHTSELQSQSNLVCRLLLEKKKKDVGIHAVTQTLGEQSRAVPHDVLLHVCALFSVLSCNRVNQACGVHHPRTSIEHYHIPS